MESVEGFTDLVLSEGFEDYENGQVPLSAIALVESRDAAIRKECAERAVAWYMMGVTPELTELYKVGIQELRAAIMGEQ